MNKSKKLDDFDDSDEITPKNTKITPKNTKITPKNTVNLQNNDKSHINNDKIYCKKIMNKKINCRIKNEKIYIEEIKDDKKIKQTYSFNKRKKRSAFYVNI